jgi:hypothetical protein
MVACWALVASVLLTCQQIVAQKEAKNFSVINPEVDALLRQGPDWLYDTLAALLIAMGAIFAFFGLKTVRLQSSFYGACICGGLASFLLYLIPGQETGQVWLGVVIPVGAIGGYLIGRVITLRKITLFVALGVAIAGVFNQYALSYFTVVPDWLIYTVMVISLIISAVFIAKYFHISAILATAFLGGFLVLLGTARLMRSQISLVGMWVDPDYMRGCVNLECWMPFLVGAATFALGSIFQLCMRRRDKKNKKISGEPIKEEDEHTPITPQRQGSVRITPPRTSASKKTPSRTTPAYGGNPFTPEPNDDPLIVELTETLGRRKRRPDQVILA